MSEYERIVQGLFSVSPEERYARAKSASWLGRLLESDAVDMNHNFIHAYHFITDGIKDSTALLRDSPAARELIGRDMVRKSIECGCLSSDADLDIVLSKLDDLLEEVPELRGPFRDIALEALRRESVLDQEAVPAEFRKVSDGLVELFRMCPEELEIIEFIFLTMSYRKLQHLFFGGLDLNQYTGRDKLAVTLGMSKVTLLERLDRLDCLGIIDISDNNFNFRNSQFQWLWFLPQGAEVEKFFCSRLSGESVPLEDFQVPANEALYVKRLLQADGDRPRHVLLYGPPGTGKTTFARSLAAELGVPAWSVKNTGMDGIRIGYGGRRMELEAAVTRASLHPGALVVVDEAENVLMDLRQQEHRKLESVDKGWINNFMERRGCRVIWIVNYPGLLDQSVRRRFSYSLHFPPPGRKERGKLWEMILARHGVDAGSLGDGLKSLVSDYRVPAAVIDIAVAQASEIGGGDLAGDIETAVSAYEILRSGGEKPCARRTRAKDFMPEALASDVDVPGLVLRLKAVDSARAGKGPAPGFGTMLFYGPPGTGKTELARHLADALQKELIVKRASDIVDPYLGETERNIAGVFREAEREDAFLVIDEADTFIFSRDMAVRSWETSFVNEFLTALEECRCFMAATSNRRDRMDPAAMRRFSFKVPFRHSGPKELEILYRRLLAPLAGAEPDSGFIGRLVREEGLAPGDFRAVLARHLPGLGGAPTHGDLLAELLLERDLKLERGLRRIGY